MLRIFIINLFTFCLLLSNPVGAIDKVLPVKVSLKSKIDQLFSHQAHQKVMQDMQVRCIDCHNFSIKSTGKGPLSPQVTNSFLQSPKKVCHQCHMGKVSTPVPNQCLLCHNKLEQLQPVDHHQNWIKTHGKVAIHNDDSCLNCHTKDGCSECHLKRDNMNSRVHRGNFRFTHSIEARSNPASCLQCHQSPSFCIDCHKGGKK